MNWKGVLLYLCFICTLNVNENCIRNTITSLIDFCMYNKVTIRLLKKVSK